MVRYYGQLHQHAVQPRPRDSTEISVVYQDNLNTVRVSTPHALICFYSTHLIWYDRKTGGPTDSPEPSGTLTNPKNTNPPE